MPGLVLALTLAAAQPLDPGRGVSETLARTRAEAISALHYELAFSIPADRGAPVEGRVVVRFTVGRQQPIVFDFAQPRDRNALPMAYRHKSGLGSCPV